MTAIKAALSFADDISSGGDNSESDLDLDEASALQPIYHHQEREETRLLPETTLSDVDSSEPPHSQKRLSAFAAVEPSLKSPQKIVSQHRGDNSSISQLPYPRYQAVKSPSATSSLSDHESDGESSVPYQSADSSRASAIKSASVTSEQAVMVSPRTDIQLTSERPPVIKQGKPDQPLSPGMKIAVRNLSYSASEPRSCILMSPYTKRVCIT